MRRSGSVFRPVYGTAAGHLKSPDISLRFPRDLSRGTIREATEAKTAKEAKKEVRPRERQERVAAGKPVQTSFEAVTSPTSTRWS